MDKQSQGAWITSCKLFMSSLEWNSISTDSDLGPGSRNGPCSGLGSTPHFSWILWKEGVWPVCVFEEKCKLSLSFFSASSINDAEERFSHVQQVSSSQETSLQETSTFFFSCSLFLLTQPILRTLGFYQNKITIVPGVGLIFCPVHIYIW